MNLSFENEVVVIVGAASGIGRATAERFEVAGAQVVRLDLMHMDGANRHQVDATDLSLLTKLAAELREEFRRIDHVVVSIGKPSGTLGFPFWNVHPSAWASVLDVNLIAPVNVAHAFAPIMLPSRQGSFCFVVSVAGQIGSQTDPPYSAAKAGLINFVQCAAKDLASHGIRVNAVSPGMVRTPMNRRVWQAWRESSPENQLDYDAWAEQKIQQVAPLGRWQTEDEVAGAICFLASKLGNNMTGQTLNVDGGQVMHA